MLFFWTKKWTHFLAKKKSENGIVLHNSHKTTNKWILYDYG